MAIAIRGTTPTFAGVDSPATVSVTLTGSKQPQTGDLLVIFHCNDFYTLANMPTPTVGGSTSGVTNVLDCDSGTNGAHCRVWWYAVGSTGDLTVSVTETGTADEDKALVVYVLSGADTATPVDASGSAIDTGGTTHNCPSISPTTSDAYLICHTNTGGGASGGGDGSYTHPSGMTETVDNRFTAGMHVGGAVLQLSASGATGTKTFTPASSVTDQANVSVAIETGGAAAPADSSAYSIARLPGLIGPDGKIFTPGRRFDNNGTAAAVTGSVAETQDNQTSTASGVLGYTGTVAETQDNQTSTASGSLGYSGTVAETQDNQTSTASGVLGYSGTLSETQDNQTSSAAGVLGYTGTVAEIQDNQTSTASGTVAGGGEVTGSVAETQDNQTSTASGVLGYSGTVARTQANQTSTASGSVTGVTSGTGASTQTNQTSSAAGVLGYSGTVARTQANQTAAATGWINVTGTVAETQDNQTSTGSGFIGQFATPDTRTYTIPADPRELDVPADNRTLIIAADQRELEVPAENRIFPVPADNRTFVVPGDEEA